MRHSVGFDGLPFPIPGITVQSYSRMNIAEAQYIPSTGEKNMVITASRRMALMQFSFKASVYRADN
jgi:hypothetical protein